MVLLALAHELNECHKARNVAGTIRIGGADFLHCWVTDSI